MGCYPIPLFATSLRFVVALCLSHCVRLHKHFFLWWGVLNFHFTLKNVYNIYKEAKFMSMIKRIEYLEELKKWKDKDLIKSIGNNVLESAMKYYKNKYFNTLNIK